MNSKPKMKPMVGWYDPRQLAKTGVEVAISTIFGTSLRSSSRGSDGFRRH